MANVLLQSDQVKKGKHSVATTRKFSPALKVIYIKIPGVFSIVFP